LQPVPDSSRSRSSSGQDGLRRLVDLLPFGADFQDCESPWRPPNIRIGESFVDSLEMILLNDSKREASDLRDHVFASITLALRSRKPHEEVILPDYAKAVQQVYVETTRFIIAQRKSIDIVVHAQRVNLGGLGSQNTDITGLPSWVPSFNRQGQLLCDPKRFDAMRNTSHQSKYRLHPHEPPFAPLNIQVD
jgi:hypothetical protein